MSELTIRPAEERDLPRLVEIYNHYVLETAVTFETEPYTVETRRPWLATFGRSGRHRCLVACESGAGAAGGADGPDGRCIGWASSRRFHERAAYAPTVETSVYLDPARRGRGAGTKLYGALFDLLRGEDVHRAIGAITLPNEASLALHRRLGFEPVGVLREVGRKHDRWWDVAWLMKAMEPRAATRA